MELCQDAALRTCPAVHCGITSAAELSSLLFSALLYLRHASVGICFH